MNTPALLKSLSNLTHAMHSATSYADALTAAIMRKGDLEIDGLVFRRRADIQIPTDYVHTGTHRVVYELVGSGKTYELAITPIKETHGGKP